MDDQCSGLRRRCLAALTALSLVTGCGDAARRPAHGPFGPPLRSELLEPFQGEWQFDVEKTLEAQKAAGAGDEDIARLRKMYAGLDEAERRARLTIKDNEGLGYPFPASEFRFFHLHRHGAKVCGKAWHHEDRFDPGDMSKCWVQLTLLDGCLHFVCHMHEGLPNLNDPDIESPGPVELGVAEKCETLAGKEWSEIMVFVRASAKPPRAK